MTPREPNRIIGRVLGYVVLAAVAWIVVVLSVAAAAMATVWAVEFLEALR